MKRAFIILAALFCANLAVAQVQYTDVNPDVIVNPGDEMGGEITITVGGQSPSYAQFAVQNYTNYGGQGSYIAVFGEGAGIVVEANGAYDAGAVSLLAEGTSIGASSNWSTAMFPVFYDETNYAAWAGQTGYAGFKVMFGSNVYYGWMKLSINADMTFTIYEYAVETTAGRAIVAGDKVGSASIVSVEAGELTAYPNPTNGKLTISNPTKVQSMGLYDLTGRVIMQLNPNAGEQTLDVSGFEAGVYFLNTQSAEGVSTKKIVIR